MADSQHIADSLESGEEGSIAPDMSVIRRTRSNPGDMPSSGNKKLSQEFVLAVWELYSGRGFADLLLLFFTALHSRFLQFYQYRAVLFQSWTAFVSVSWAFRSPLRVSPPLSSRQFA
jgi:hypothetical protein